MKVTAIAPVLNEVDYIGYSIMACLDQMHQFIYALDEKSKDGTRELLDHVKTKYAKEKLIVFNHPTFHPSDMNAYNGAFQACLEKATGDVVMFLHPDQVITNPEVLEKDWPKALAWYTTLTSYARDFNTVILKGRCTTWKNIHRRTFGLHYFGGYGSQNEDFYHADITGKSYRHYGPEFSKYPYPVLDSGLLINHYCETKDYTRRLEKMKLCLKTLYPNFSDERITELAIQHPRVTLEESSTQFGRFEFSDSESEVPDVFSKYKETFDAFRKEPVSA